MSITLLPSNDSGWFSTVGTGNLSPSPIQSTIMGLAFLLAVGTGGVISNESLANYQYPEAGIQFVPREASRSVCATRAPSENVQLIRRILSPTVTELASLFNVSRQTIYDWQGGTRPGVENERKLADLSGAAEILEMEGIQVTSYLLKRSIVGGKSFYDLVREGATATDVARRLSHVVIGELRQRRMLDTQLADRIGKAKDRFDAGVPAFNEKN